ncbi:MAG: hypothetical protein JWP66_517 [Naasia sp.]|nr:hypothetical protein [Naasia sp.]
MTTERSRIALEALPRGVLALLLALVVTFSQDHSPALGLTVFGLWAVLTGAAIVALGRRARAQQGLAGGVVHIFGGALALAVLLVVPASAPGLLVPVLAGTLALAGGLDIAGGLARGTAADGLGRDGVALGAANLLVVVGMLVFAGDPVVTVGLLGAWAAIAGVYLVIGALSVPASARKAHSA